MPHRHFQANRRGARDHTGTLGAVSTHVLMRNNMGNVLQDQLSPLAVLVQLLEEYSWLEVPSGERHRCGY